MKRPNALAGAYSLSSAPRPQEIELERWTADPSGRVVVERARTGGTALTALTRLLEAWSLPWRVASEAISLVVGVVALAVMMVGQIAMALVNLVVAIVGFAFCLVIGAGMLWVGGQFGVWGTVVSAGLFLSIAATLLLGAITENH